VVAYHELGHTLVALALPGTDPMHKVSIIPRGIGALGYTIQRPTEDRFLMTREELENKIAVLLGGRAAEKLVFGHLSTGADDDMDKATDIARSMVTRYGMDEKLGYVTYDAGKGSFLGQPGALASIASAVALAHVLFISAASWTVLRALHGACYTGLILIAESWLNGCTDRAHRGRVLSVYGIVVMGAWAASQPLLNLAPPRDFVLFCVVSILLSLSLVPVALARATAPVSTATTLIRFRELYGISPLGVAGAFVAGLTSSALWGMGPTFAKLVGLDTAQVSIFMTAALAGALVLQWPLGVLSDHVDRRKVILCAATGTALASSPSPPT